MKNVFHVFSRMFTKFLGEHPFSSTHSAHLASASRLCSVRIGLALILALFAAASSWATDYITDVMVLGGDKSTISQMKSDYEQKGWIFIDDDLNDGAGGDYVHVLYKKSSSYSSNVITDIIIKTGEHPDSYIFNGRTYYRAPHDGSEYFKSYGGNLNSATTVSSSTNMRLYYTKEEFSDKRAVSKIAFTVADNNETKTKDGYTTLGRNGAVVGSDGSGALDLNEGAGSDSKYIYMHISTVQSVLAGALKYISDVVVFGGEKDDVNALKERYASQGWVVIDQDLNDGAGSGTDYVYLAYKKSPLSEDGNGFITDFIIKTDDYPDTYEFNGRTYYRAPNFGSEHFEAHGGNLNSGTRSSSTNMRLYFTREKFPDTRIVSDIAFTTGEDNKTKNGYTTLGKDGAAVGSDGSGALDLNEGVGYTSDYIYMHFATILKSLDVVDLAALTGDYVATDGKILMDTLGGNYKISIANGATVTLKNAVINGVDNENYQWAGLTCEGDCKIVLDKGSENSVKGFYRDYPGIYVPEGYTLTIEGSGKLDVIGGTFAAGIGGGHNSSVGNITINGGTVTTTGGDCGAGIGGGYTNGGKTTVGDITINGGTVTATGGDDGAGIGSGFTYNTTTTVSDITINGGTVTATGGYSGAGIGSGSTGNSGTTTVGDITINGGTVTATGGYSAAGIGSGSTGNSGKTTVGDITINGGTVTATGGECGAGIGSGFTCNSATTTVGDITIQGGTVTTTGGDCGAGIGSGFTCNSGTTTIGDITIQGGTVTATGGNYGAGIGGGYTSYVTTTVGDITIKGGTVAAQGFVDIGKGYISGPKAKAEIGSILLYHGFKEIDATITGKPVYMYGETDVSSNPSEYFGIDGSVTRSLFAIGTDKLSNGKVVATTASANGKAYADEHVTLAVTPDFGYSFKSLSVKDDEGNTVEVKDNSFVMPLGDVTVSADFASKYPMLTFSDNGKKVTVNGTYGGTETFELDEDITVENVVFNREFAVGVFSTLTLPFDVSTEYLEGFGMVLTFNGLKQKDDGKWVVRMKKFWEKNVTSEFKTLDAYTPYLVLMDESSLKVNTSVQILTTKEPIAKAAGSNWEFRGTLAYKKWEEGDSELGRVYGFAAESKDGIQAGQFVKAGAGAYIYPLRAYLLKKPAASGVRSSIAGGKSFATMSLPDEIDVEIEDDDGNEPKTTVVGKFNTRTGEFRMNSDAARSFDVKGRNVGNKANKARGAYYKKGGKAAVTR